MSAEDCRAWATAFTASATTQGALDTVLQYEKRSARILTLMLGR